MAGRVFATVVIWIAFTIISTVVLTVPTSALSDMSGDTVFNITLVLAGAAALSTIAVWIGGPQDDKITLPAKSKRRGGQNRVERLVEQLDDEDIYDLEALLLSREHSAKRRDTLR